MQIQGHSFKPAVRFYGKNDYHLGVELELEGPNETVKLEGLEIIKRPTWCYAKQDGSLGDHGWELVTHPISRQIWMGTKKRSPAGLFFAYVEKLQEMGHKSFSTGRCGLHVHVSNEAFHNYVYQKSTPRRDPSLPPQVTEQKRNCLHLYWFKRIVNTNLFAIISQRAPETLSRWSKMYVPVVKDELSTGDRYSAVNLTEKTVEVRIFRGNLRQDRIRKALEAVVSAVELSRTLTSKEYKSDAEALFLGYANAKKAEYPNLHAFLVEVGRISEADPRKISGSKKENAKVCAS